MANILRFNFQLQITSKSNESATGNNIKSTAVSASASSPPITPHPDLIAHQNGHHAAPNAFSDSDGDFDVDEDDHDHIDVDVDDDDEDISDPEPAQSACFEPPTELPSLVIPMVYDVNANITQLAERRDATGTIASSATNTASQLLRRFAEQHKANAAATGECTIFPAIRELLTNYVMPVESTAVSAAAATTTMNGGSEQQQQQQQSTSAATTVTIATIPSTVVTTKGATVVTTVTQQQLKLVPSQVRNAQATTSVLKSTARH